MSVMTERAKCLARMVHADEVRKSTGEPYYVHNEAVAEAVKDMGEKIETAALLHDTLENAKKPATIRLLLADYFPKDVIFLVETLTNDKNIYYTRYIEIVCNNPDALIIKLSDMIDNTKDIDSPNYPEKQKAKYREACIYMLSRGIEVPKILKERLKIEK